MKSVDYQNSSLKLKYQNAIKIKIHFTNKSGIDDSRCDGNSSYYFFKPFPWCTWVLSSLYLHQYQTHQEVMSKEGCLGNFKERHVRAWLWVHLPSCHLGILWIYSIECGRFGHEEPNHWVWLGFFVPSLSSRRRRSAHCYDQYYFSKTKTQWDLGKDPLIWKSTLLMKGTSA